MLDLAVPKLIYQLQVESPGDKVGVQGGVGNPVTGPDGIAHGNAVGGQKVQDRLLGDGVRKTAGKGFRQDGPDATLAAVKKVHYKSRIVVWVNGADDDGAAGGIDGVQVKVPVVGSHGREGRNCAPVVGIFRCKLGVFTV